MHDLFVPARRGIRTAFLLLAALALPGCDPNITDKDIIYLPFSKIQELHAKSQGSSPKAALFVDPRAPQDFEAGHIRGARNLSLRQVNPKRDRDPELEEYDILIVYGDNPGSAPAKAMVKRLLLLGYDDVKWFPGGMEEWRDNNLPIDPPQPPRPAPQPAPPAAQAPEAAPPQPTQPLKPKPE
ncbi:MAG: rhodanese-like domain-containing protein [Phycisphaerales bacterium]|nr:rhodanese-like domain-containing protein [Phycisphaerales bacterium]